MKKLYVDKRVCLGCRFCEIICSLVHSGNKVNPSRSRIRLQEDPANSIFEPVVCRECRRPKCVEACEHNAIRKRSKLGVPVIDKEACVYCLECLKACPFDAVFPDGQEETPLICDLCDGDPQCVKYCPVHPTKTHAALIYTTPEKWKKVKSGPTESALDNKK